MTRTLVEIRNLTKIYTPSPMWMRMLLRTAINEPVTALAAVSLSVEAGTICAVVGPNGAGKSTLFRILTGLTTPTDGSATVCGRDATRDSAEVRRLIGFMPSDDRSLFLRFSCEENLSFHGRLHAIPERRLSHRIDEALEVVGLAHARKHAGFALSSGMRARLQLARALLHNPSVLILDEPTGSVDPLAAHEFLKVLHRVAVHQGVAVLISSHRLEEIEALDDNVVLLDRGKLIYKGDLDSLRQIWEQPRIQVRFNSERAALHAAELLTAGGVQLLTVQLPTLTLAPGVKISSLLRLLDGHLDAVNSVAESRMPLRELLAQMLGARTTQICGDQVEKASAL
ncbi:MAG: ABC transporter ATP-binding protein [Egibacteraceae bacterium]